MSRSAGDSRTSIKKVLSPSGPENGMSWSDSRYLPFVIVASVMPSSLLKRGVAPPSK